MTDCDWMTTCADCGVTHYRAEPCPYCFEVVERYTVKLRNRVLYRGYDEAEAERVYRQPGLTRLHIEKGVVINRRADHPYEG
jgi:hypothetical protein